VFTTDEAWHYRYGNAEGSIHLELFPTLPAAWFDAALGEKWERVRRIRRVVTGALEVERREKRIGASLEARPRVHLTAADRALLAELDLAELAITSGIELSDAPAPADAFRLPDVPEVAVVPALAPGDKCQRCWQIYEVLERDGICARCADAVAAVAAA
jgi:isoleucyl-tRNA synthetase